MKRVGMGILVLMLGMVGVSEAGGYHKHGKNCSYPCKAGPAGPQGPAGDPGENGADGRDGRDGRDLRGGTVVNIGAEVRWYDWKHASLYSGYRRDLRHGGNTIDAAILQIKLGSSYEQRRIDDLEAKIAALVVPVVVPVSTDEPARGVIRGGQ